LRTLLRQFEHTVGVNRFFVRLIADAGAHGARVVRWLSASEATERFEIGGETRWLRPDGAADIHLAGRLHRVYLEWDRGTVKLPDLVEKRRLYAAYYASLARTGVPEANRPTTLLVTSSPLRESILYGATEAAVDEVKASPGYFFTTVDTLVGRVGPLAPVWRTPESHGRVSWCDSRGRSA
ncbi:MAG TPA: replication-relaxation family protein, partial [Dehalococcoidia bacterium]|nr:replication-relaxation family protein [Dehalococcoidia bacterium]